MKLINSMRLRKNHQKLPAVLIAMVRNEKGIIEAFCSHALALFDRVIIVDHLSTDGTREYLTCLTSKYPQVECYYFNHPGRYQSDLMTYISSTLIDQTAPGWVFFMDADEFLPFKTKEEFDQALSEFRIFPTIKMPWLNLIPIDWDSGQIINGAFLTPPRYSQHRKIAFQPSRLRPHKYVISEGNHYLSINRRVMRRALSINAFPIYHIPIRTKEQIRQKILISLDSLEQKAKDRTPGENGHFEIMHNIMITCGLSDDLMAGLASKYGEELSFPYERSTQSLLKAGYAVHKLDVASLSPFVTFDDMARHQNFDEKGAHKDEQAKLVNICFDQSTRSMHLEPNNLNHYSA